METRTIGLIGGGRVARILLSGWAQSGSFAGTVRIFDKDPAVLKGLQDLLPGKVAFVDSPGLAAASDVVLLALHPPVLLETLAMVKSDLQPGNLVVSLGPKITLAAMQTVLGATWPLARVNPSAPGIVGEGLNPLCVSEQTTAKDLQYLEDLFGLLGSVPVVDEHKLEAYALVSAMGPTYFWFQWEQLSKLAVTFGLDPKESREVIERMLSGAARTLFHSGLSVDQVMDLVPVKPLGDKEETIKSFYSEQLTAIYAKIKPVTQQRSLV